MKRLVGAALGVLLLLVPVHGADADVLPGGYEPHVGDILFQSSPPRPLSSAIEAATHSPYSHCGMVVRGRDGFRVLHAIGPVHETPLADWIAHGRDGGFAVYRLKDSYLSAVGPMVKAARRYLGRPYDVHYRFDEESIYCSELVYIAFREATGEKLGRVRRLGELDWRPAEPVIRAIEKGGLPLEREMITPVDLALAEQLEPVLSYRIGPAILEAASPVGK